MFSCIYCLMIQPKCVFSTFLRIPQSTKIKPSFWLVCRSKGKCFRSPFCLVPWTVVLIAIYHSYVITGMCDALFASILLSCIQLQCHPLDVQHQPIIQLRLKYVFHERTSLFLSSFVMLVCCRHHIKRSKHTTTKS